MNDCMRFFPNSATSRTVGKTISSDWRFEKSFQKGLAFNTQGVAPVMGHTVFAQALSSGNNTSLNHFSFATFTGFSLLAVRTVSTYYGVSATNRVFSLMLGGLLTTIVDKYTWVTFTNVAQSSATLSKNAYQAISGVGIDYAIVLDGSSTSYAMDKVAWITLASSAATISPTVARSNMGYTSNELYSLYCSGIASGVGSTLVDKLTWSTMTVSAQASATFGTHRNFIGNGGNDLVNTYIFGGYTAANQSTYTATSEKLDWATLTRTAGPSATVAAPGIACASDSIVCSVSYSNSLNNKFLFSTGTIVTVTGVSNFGTSRATTTTTLGLQ